MPLAYTRRRTPGGLVRGHVNFLSSFEAAGINTADFAASRNPPLATLKASGYASAPAAAFLFRTIFTGLRRGTEAPVRESRR